MGRRDEGEQVRECEENDWVLRGFSMFPGPVNKLHKVHSTFLMLFSSYPETRFTNTIPDDKFT